MAVTDGGAHGLRSPAGRARGGQAGRHVLIQGGQGVPRSSRRRSVEEREEDAGDDLKYEDEERRASEDVEPTRRPVWHGVRHDCLRRARELNSRVEPPADSFDQAHDDLRTDRVARAPPGVGIAPASMNRVSPSTLYRYSNRPRSGGPEARAPSA